MSITLSGFWTATSGFLIGVASIQDLVSLRQFPFMQRAIAGAILMGILGSGGCQSKPPIKSPTVDKPADPQQVNARCSEHPELKRIKLNTLTYELVQLLGDSGVEIEHIENYRLVNWHSSGSCPITVILKDDKVLGQKQSFTFTPSNVSKPPRLCVENRSLNDLKVNMPKNTVEQILGDSGIEVESVENYRLVIWKYHGLCPIIILLKDGKILARK